MRVVTWVLISVLFVLSPPAMAFKLGDARFTISFEESVIKIMVIDVDRDQNTDLSGRLYSANTMAQKFSFRPVGAGKDIMLIATLDQQIREPLELILTLEMDDQKTSRRYQINPSSKEPLDGAIEVTAADLESLPVALQFDLNLSSTVYVVSEGQSLWDVASDIALPGGNDFQRVLALFATNRHLFDNGDINQLSTRTVLAIPSLSYVNSFDPIRSATVFFGVASGQLMIDAFLESTEKLATSSSIQIPTEQMILARRVRFLEQQLLELDEKYKQKFRRIDQEFDRRMRDIEDKTSD